MVEGERSPYKESTLICVSGRSIDAVRREIQELIKRNKSTLARAARNKKQDTADFVKDHLNDLVLNDPTYLINALYEHDVDSLASYLVRTGIRCGKWYWVDAKDCDIRPATDEWNAKQPFLRILAWDIETHKAPLKFPQASIDPIMSISYYTEHGGYLLINREFFSRDIDDFTFLFKSEFRVHNFPDEKSLIDFYLWHVKYVCRPQIIVSYNGDSFDFPYLAERCTRHGLSLKEAWGFAATIEPTPNVKPSYISPDMIHMDCLKWVERDSYLPCGSRGLKAVARAKLGYEPNEVDPELMVDYCWNKPQEMANYSVSDALATYKLYMQYVHAFTLALSSIIPLTGSGTLCEHLLMAEAYRRNILIPNKSVESDENWMDEDTLLLAETYVGGQVEQLRTGIYRSDFAERFNFDAEIVDKLVNDLDNVYNCWLRREIAPRLQEDADIVGSNWQSDIRPQIERRLLTYKVAKTLTIEPLIYHMDVGAMYPNIILSQRLQPYSVIDPQRNCSSCPYYDERSDCLRPLKWRWRGEKLNLNKHIIKTVVDQLNMEKFPNPQIGGSGLVEYQKLPLRIKREVKTERLKHVAAKLNKNKFRSVLETMKEGHVCQRQNSFYVDTVRDFRDRRLVYKKLKKQADQKLEGAPIERKAEYTAAAITYDSLQLAHKCILNSFYGYVMRKGARWYSLEMAAIVTHTGAQIIKLARDICNGVGIPLELDTDGVWTLLPKGFPDNFDINLTLSNGDTRTFSMSYPCWMLNALVETQWANDQYQMWENTGFKRSCENSVFFEIDGPYRAMFLPASEKEGQQLKKRYAVFDQKGRISELKGFEIKRRGELELLKHFQEEVFPNFLNGSTREECYAAVGQAADNWFTFVKTQGRKSDDIFTILSLLAESTTMTKPAQQQIRTYKSMGITTAIRLQQCRDDPTYINDAGVRCTYVIIKYPEKQPRTERAVPVSIFFSDRKERSAWLRKWSGGAQGENKLIANEQDEINEDLSVVELLRRYIDWEYYCERLSTTIQKIVVIPAIQQGCSNPCQVAPPIWCANLASQDAKQQSLSAWIKQEHTKAKEVDTADNAPTQVEPEGPSSAAMNWKTSWQDYCAGLPINTLAVRHTPFTIHSGFVEKTIFWLEDLLFCPGGDICAILRSPMTNRLLQVPIVLQRTTFVHGIAKFYGTALDRRVGGDHKRRSIGPSETGSTVDSFLYRVESGAKQRVDVISFKNGSPDPLGSLTKAYNENPKQTITCMEQVRCLPSTPSQLGGCLMDARSLVDGDLTKAKYLEPYTHTIELLLRPSNEGRYILSNTNNPLQYHSHNHSIAGLFHAFVAITAEEGIWLCFFLNTISEAPVSVTVLTGQTRRLAKSLCAARLEASQACIKSRLKRLYGLEPQVRSVICNETFFNMNEMYEYSRDKVQSFPSSSCIRLFIVSESCRHLGVELEANNAAVGVASYITVRSIIPDIDAGELNIDLNNRIVPELERVCHNIGISNELDRLPLATLVALSSEDQIAAYVSRELWNLDWLLPDLSPTHLTCQNRLLYEFDRLSPLLMGGVWRLGSTDLLTYEKPGVYRCQLVAIPFEQNALLETLRNLDILSDDFKKQQNVRGLANLKLNRRNQTDDLAYLKANHNSGAMVVLQMLHDLFKQHQKAQHIGDSILLYLQKYLPEAYEQLCKTWLPLWRKQVIEQVEALSETMRKKLTVVKIDMFGVIVMIPTLSARDARAFSGAMTKILSRRGVLTDALKAKDHQYYRHGLIIDSANSLLIDNEGDIVQCTLPICSPLADRSQEVVEDLLVQFLEIPFQSRETDQIKQFEERVTHFVKDEWLMLIEQSLDALPVGADMWTENPCVLTAAETAVSSDLIGSLLYRLTLLEKQSECRQQIVSDDNYRSALLEVLGLDECIADSCTFTLVGLLIANRRCANCLNLIPQVLCFSADGAVCPRCNSPFSNEMIESSLVAFAELAYTHAVTGCVQRCPKCRLYNTSYMMKYCHCGTKFDNDFSTEFHWAKQVLMKFAAAHNWEWLQASLHEL